MTGSIKNRGDKVCVRYESQPNWKRFYIPSALLAITLLWFVAAALVLTFVFLAEGGNNSSLLIAGLVLLVGLTLSVLLLCYRIWVATQAHTVLELTDSSVRVNIADGKHEMVETDIPLSELSAVEYTGTVLDDVLVPQTKLILHRNNGDTTVVPIVIFTSNAQAIIDFFADHHIRVVLS